MRRKIYYEDCIRFIEHEFPVKLYPYQKEMLRDMCDGREFRSARCLGRSTVARLFGAYIAHLYDQNDYDKEPEAVFTYKLGVRYGLYPYDYIAGCKAFIGRDRFDREYNCM